ncbi:MAG: protein O-mannosyl-transferase family, partial [Desulfobaccales bacterium]
MPTLRRPRLRSTALSGAFFFLGVFSLYCAGHCASVFLDDSGETITVAAGLGVGHPPGYPLHSLLAHLAVQCWPWGGPAEAVNLLAAFCATLALTLLAGLAGTWAQERQAGRAGTALALLPCVLMA